MRLCLLRRLYLIACVAICFAVWPWDSRAASCTAGLVATSATARVTVATPLAVLPTAEATSPVISQVAQTTLPVVWMVDVVSSIGALTTEHPTRRAHAVASVIAVTWGIIADRMKVAIRSVNYPVGAVRPLVGSLSGN